MEMRIRRHREARHLFIDVCRIHGAESNANCAKSGQETSIFIFLVIPTCAEHEHGDRAEAADEEVAKAGIVVRADGTLNDMRAVMD